MFEMVDYIDERKAKELNISPCVELRCNCRPGAVGDEPLDKFETVTDKYCVLKDGITLTCELCGQVHTEKYIPKETHSKVQLPPLPHCPTCNSTNLEKISTTSKFISFATAGVFSNSFGKTFHCKNCGYRW